MGRLFASEKDRKYAMLGLRIVGDFGATIAIPAVIFVIIGQWLDGKYNKSPWFTILAFVLAAMVSGRSIYKKAKTYGKEYEALNANETGEKNKTNELSELDKPAEPDKQ